MSLNPNAGIGLSQTLGNELSANRLWWSALSSGALSAPPSCYACLRISLKSTEPTVNQLS